MDNFIELGDALGRYCIALAMIAFGVQHVVYADFVTRLVPRLPAWIPGHAFLACAFGAYLVAAGVALWVRETARLAALLLAGTLLASLGLFYLPAVVASLTDAGLWTKAGKALTLSGGAFLIAASLPGEARDPTGALATVIKALEKCLPMGRYFLGAFLTFCGVLHFIYVPFVAGLIPAWISSPIFWTYFSGVALIAGGLGVSVRPTARLAATLTALMVFLWVLMLHIPRALANLRDANETTAVFEAIAITGTALLVATSKQRLAPPRPDTSVRSARAGASVLLAGREVAQFESVRRRRGFTLIELLVVIAILAILAGMLMPALTKAKSKAQGVVCLSNMKQLGFGWIMYTHDFEDRVPPNPGMTISDPRLNWVTGFLTLDAGDNLGHAGRDNTDNTNTVFLMNSLLWPYHRALGVWRCPGDTSMSTIAAARYPHVRTVSMNNWVGNYDPRNGAVTEYSPGFKVFKKAADMTSPGPSRIFLLLDEREDSINDGSYLMLMDGFNPSTPASRTIVDYPSSYHNGAGGLNFCDGHAEVHRWLDARTTPLLRRDTHLTQIPARPSPNNPDVFWIQERTTTKK